MATVQHFFVRNLSAALLAGDWTRAALWDRAGQACGHHYRWLRPLIRRVLTQFPSPPLSATLERYLRNDSELNHIWMQSFWSRSGARRLAVARVYWIPDQMSPPLVTPTQPVPPLPTLGSLASWLGLTPQSLDWFVDQYDMNPDAPIEEWQHYYFRWVPKRSTQTGSKGPKVQPEPIAESKPSPTWLNWWASPKSPTSPLTPSPEPRPAQAYRLLEIPKPRLKQMQRQILDQILSRVPAHPGSHGFIRGRSVVSNAQPHCGKSVILRFDLAHFFPSIPWGRIQAIFRSLGYPDTVASALAGLCTVRTSWKARVANPTKPMTSHQFHMLMQMRHLPQGSPTSPALANLAAFHLDCRLSGLAAAFGATYTRYADDLTFSGGYDLYRLQHRITLAISQIVQAEGLLLNPKKSRVMGRATRQTVTGIVVNAKPNLRRVDYDRLKAILTNCLRHGPVSQNRTRHGDFQAHLLGHIARWNQVNPTRGAKLQALYDRIIWPATA